MARQLLQDRTPAAYAGVEAYARHHSQEDAGALAWLVLGYAHVLDKDYAKAVDPSIAPKPRPEIWATTSAFIWAHPTFRAEKQRMRSPS